jgi:hypothetical protein
MDVEKALTTMLLTVGGFVAAMALLALAYPSIAGMGNAIAADRAGMSTQSREAIAAVNAASELDAGGAWQDSDADTYFDLYVWAKNVGATTIARPDGIDVFVFSEGIAERIPHASDTASYPQWTATVEGGGSWGIGRTLKITVHYESALAPGDYTIEITAPSGMRAFERFAL